jgi:hypothetical protein
MAGRGSPPWPWPSATGGRPASRRASFIVELRDVAAHVPDSIAELHVGRGAGVEVHAHDFLTALRH